MQLFMMDVPSIHSNAPATLCSSLNHSKGSFEEEIVALLVEQDIEFELPYQAVVTADLLHKCQALALPHCDAKATRHTLL